MPTPINLEHVLDIALIFISGFAVFYCWLLSRRLQRLQSLETGLGASIVSLTEAITKTNQAAVEARESTVGTVNTLKALLRNAEDTLPQVEARLESLRNVQRNAQNKQDELNAVLQNSIDPALKNARTTSKSLLQIVTEIQKYQTKSTPKSIA